MNHNTSSALHNTWSSFLSIDVLEDEEAVIYSDDIKTMELYKEVYLNHFNSKFLKNAKIKKGKCQWNIKPNLPFFDYLKTERKPNNKFSYSMAKKDRKDASYGASYKGVDDDMYESMKELLHDQIDLGDSRNFKSADELNDKFIKLLNCKTFIGTENSWSMLAQSLHIPSTHLCQIWPHKSLKRIKINDVRTYVDPLVQVIT
tara:strand:- start:1292 stop:1897 length:606 start_codon:yes stop_codon:yes gene_type:complete